MTVRAIVFAGFGINCEEETCAALRLAGAEADIVHLARVFAGKVSLDEYQAAVFPGGFSFGDDLGSGRVLANRMSHKRIAGGRTLRDALERFLADGGLVLGICNGFQILVKAGLLPFGGEDGRASTTLARNDANRFEDRWVRVRANPASRSPLLRGIGVIDLPVRHGEGKVLFASDAVRARVEAERLVAFTYVDANSEPTQRYPDNPNGAELACAGLTDPSGQVLGLMPHPEAFTHAWLHPDDARRRRADDGDGLALFRNLVEHVEGRGAFTKESP